MPKNYERYVTFNHRQLNKKGLSYGIYRQRPDMTIIPFINTFKEKKVLEVGIGGGYYTGYFLQNRCLVTGVDINPHLGSHLGLEIIKATADDFSRFLHGMTFDVVASFWMTEYLSWPELKAFFQESFLVLSNNGTIITTVIENNGLGKFYTWASGLRKIQKYCFDEKEFLPFFPGGDVSIRKLRGLFGLPFAYLVCAGT